MYLHMYTLASPSRFACIINGNDSNSPIGSNYAHKLLALICFTHNTRRVAHIGILMTNTQYSTQ